MVFYVKFTVEFTGKALNFSMEESKENDLIKQQEEASKRGQFENFYFH